MSASITEIWRAWRDAVDHPRSAAEVAARRNDLAAAIHARATVQLATESRVPLQHREELAQQAVLKVLTHLEGGAEVRGTGAALVRTAVSNLLVDRHRRVGTRAEVLDAGAPGEASGIDTAADLTMADPADTAGLGERALLGALAAAMARLDEGKRALIELVELEGDSGAGGFVQRMIDQDVEAARAAGPLADEAAFRRTSAQRWHQRCTQARKQLRVGAVALATAELRDALRGVRGLTEADIEALRVDLGLEPPADYAEVLARAEARCRAAGRPVRARGALEADIRRELWDACGRMERWTRGGAP